MSSPSPSPLLYGLFRPECYDTFFIQHNFFDFVCLKFLLSKVLSYGILFGAMIVKVPQIINIIRSKSTQGLSPIMYGLENISYMIAIVYNFRYDYPFSTFGESVFLLIQGFILVGLFALYNKRLALIALGLPVFLAMAYYLYVLCPLEQLAFFQAGTIALFASSRLPQIYSNYRNGTTGVLSIVTVMMNFFGNTARIFTTLQEVKDGVVLAQVICSWLLNGILFSQLIYYWKATNAAKAQASKTKVKKTQ